MKFSLGWLKQHLETDASAAQIAETLTAIGLEVEDVSNPAEALAPFRVARVLAPISTLSELTGRRRPRSSVSQLSREARAWTESSAPARSSSRPAMTGRTGSSSFRGSGPQGRTLATRSAS